MALNSNLSKQLFSSPNSLSGSLKYLVVESWKGGAHQHRLVQILGGGFFLARPVRSAPRVCVCSRVCTGATVAGDRQRTLVLKCYRQPLSGTFTSVTTN